MDLVRRRRTRAARPRERGDASDIYPQPFRQALLDARFQVIVFDPRDAGLSSDGGDTSTMTDMADVIAVLDAAGVARAHVAGFSMGGLLLVDLATLRRSGALRDVPLGDEPGSPCRHGPRLLRRTDGRSDRPWRVMGEIDEEDKTWLASSLPRPAQRARPTRRPTASPGGGLPSGVAAARLA